MAAVDLETLGDRLLTVLNEADQSEKLTYREANQVIALVEAKEVDAQEGSTLKIRTFSELRNLPESEAHWVVYRFLAQTAITDLSAFIKSGKSTLSAQLITAICQGTEFLDEYPGEQGAVVLLTEEPPATLLEAFADTGLTEKDPLHILLWTENDLVPWEEAVAGAVACCVAVGAKTLVVDTLSQWAGVDDENDASQARKAMNPLLQAAATGLAVLMVRQSRKDGGQIHNAGRGSSAFAGAASILLHLDYIRDEKGHYDDTSTLRFLSIKSRLEREQAPPMKLDYVDGKYRYQRTAGTIFGVATTAEKILKHLAVAGAVAPRDLATALGLKSPSVRKELMRLKAKGSVRIQADGKYLQTGAWQSAVAIPVASVAQVDGAHPHHPPKGGDVGIATPLAASLVPATLSSKVCPECGASNWFLSDGDRHCRNCGKVWTP